MGWYPPVKGRARAALPVPDRPDPQSDHPSVGSARPIGPLIVVQLAGVAPAPQARRPSPIGRSCLAMKLQRGVWIEIAGRGADLGLSRPPLALGAPTRSSRASVPTKASGRASNVRFEKNPRFGVGSTAWVDYCMWGSLGPPSGATQAFWFSQTADDMVTTLAVHTDLEQPCPPSFLPNLPQTRGCSYPATCETPVIFVLEISLL